jgi:hypothetical protein
MKTPDGRAQIEATFGNPANSDGTLKVAIRVNDNDSDEVWAIFVRNWGNEGYCGTHQEYLPVPPSPFVTFYLPWRGGSDVAVADGTSFEFGPDDLSPALKDQVSGPNISYTPHEGVYVNFSLPPPDSRAFIDGELHLRWIGAGPVGPPPSPAILGSSRPRQAVKDDTAEHVIAEIVKHISQSERVSLLDTIKPKRNSRANFPLRRYERIRSITHLPSVVRAVQVPQQAADPKSAARNRLVMESLCAAFHGYISSVPGACSKSEGYPSK